MITDFKTTSSFSFKIYYYQLLYLLQRTCNGFVLQMAHFYSTNRLLRNPPKTLQKDTMESLVKCPQFISSLKCIFMINFRFKRMPYQPHLALSLL